MKKTNWFIIVFAVAVGVGGGSIIGNIVRGQAIDWKHLAFNVCMLAGVTLLMLIITRKPEPKEENSSGKEIKRKKRKKKR